MARAAVAGRVAVSGRVAALPDQNLFVRSEEFDHPAWSVVGTVVVTPNAVLAPDGTMTADQLDFNGSSYIQQNTTLDATGSYLYSLWLRAASPVTFRVEAADNNDGVPAYNYAPAVGVSWTRFSFSYAATIDTSSAHALILGYGGAFFTGTVFAWGAQLVRGAALRPYIKTTSTVVGTDVGLRSAPSGRIAIP